MLTVTAEIQTPRIAYAEVTEDNNPDGSRVFTVIAAAPGLIEATAGGLHGAPGTYLETADLDVAEAHYRAGLEAVQQARAKLRETPATA